MYLFSRVLLFFSPLPLLRVSFFFVFNLQRVWPTTKRIIIRWIFFFILQRILFAINNATRTIFHWCVREYASVRMRRKNTIKLKHLEDVKRKRRSERERKGLTMRKRVIKMRERDWKIPRIRECFFFFYECIK